METLSATLLDRLLDVQQIRLRVLLDPVCVEDDHLPVVGPLRARTWFGQFRELAPGAGIENIEATLSP